MPFPGTRIIPEAWSRHHAAPMPTSFNAEVEIGHRSGEVTYDPATDTTTAAYTADYSGGARVQRLEGDRSVDYGEQILTGQPYLVEVGFDCPAISRGHRVRVRSAINDPSMVDEDLWVVSAPFGSERFTRPIFCSDSAQDAAVPA